MTASPAGRPEDLGWQPRVQAATTGTLVRMAESAIVVTDRWASSLPVRSLCWDGDDLVDWVGGGSWWSADGAWTGPAVNYAFPFDRAMSSPTGRYQALYCEFGTKGLLLERGKIIREIDRSFYHAADYEYPITLGVLAGGREVIVHCPEAYGRLEIDDLESGARLTNRPGDPPHFFHSRLSVSPGGTKLLSGGWIWHPVGVVRVIDLVCAIEDPAALDARDEALWAAVNTGAQSSCWLTDDELVVVAAHDEERFDADAEDCLQPGEIGVWSLIAHAWQSRTAVEEELGVVLSLGSTVLSLYGHPKQLDPRTGVVLRRWPELETGRRTDPFDQRTMAPVAVHPRGDRFAVADGESVSVVRV